MATRDLIWSVLDDEASGVVVASGRTDASVSGTLTVGTDLNLDTQINWKMYSGTTFTYDGSSTPLRPVGLAVEGTVKGTSHAGPADLFFGQVTTIQDDASVGNWAVTGAVNNGSGLIRLTATGHGLATNDVVGVYAVGGVTAANGWWKVTKIDANTVDLQGSSFSGTYSSGGTITNRPSYYGAIFVLRPSVSRGGLTGTAENGDDVNGVAVLNTGTAYGTSAFNINHNPAFGSSPEWVGAVGIEGNAIYGVRMTGTYQSYGISLEDGSYGIGQMLLKNNVGIYARNNAGSSDVPILKFNTLDELEMTSKIRIATANFIWQDGTNVGLGITTGTKLGNTSTEKLGFWGATPVVRPTGWAAATNTKTRTTFDTTTVTLPVLAAHVGALIDDLISEGLIGA